jgi:hypothetical protein
MAKIISVEFDLGLPNEYMVDHSQSEGKTRKFTYHGPDKIYLQLGEDGTEKHGPLIEDDIIDGRPVPADVVEWYEVDCATNPLVCQLRGPVLNELQESYDDEPYVHPNSPVLDGTSTMKIYGPPKPCDIYDATTGIKKEADGSLSVRKISALEAIHGDERNITTLDLKRQRDQLLRNSDGQVAPDMPIGLRTEWEAYRQKLRDFPAVIESAGIDPNIAFYMFPDQPAGATSDAEYQILLEQQAKAAAEG